MYTCVGVHGNLSRVNGYRKTKCSGKKKIKFIISYMYIFNQEPTLNLAQN